MNKLKQHWLPITAALLALALFGRTYFADAPAPNMTQSHQAQPAITHDEPGSENGLASEGDADAEQTEIVQTPRQMSPECGSLEEAFSVKGEFDGKKLYRAYFLLFDCLELSLVEPGKRHEWASEWEHKFDTGSELATETGAYKAVNAMVDSLGQKHNHFADPETWKMVTEKTAFSGIDAELSVKGSTDAYSTNQVISENNPLTVWPEPRKDGPAGKAGIKRGDIIASVDGRSLDGMPIEKAVALLRGEEGSTVVLKIRNDEGERDVSIVRAEVDRPAIRSRNLNGITTYILIEDFEAKHVVDQMGEVLDQATKAGIKNFVIDLRGNPGGNYDYTIFIIQMLLPEGAILNKVGREGDMLLEERFFLTKENGKYGALGEFHQGGEIKARSPLGRSYDPRIAEDAKIVVLVDRHSASGAEFLAGALKANKRATIIGETTYGKNVAQQYIPGPYGTGAAVTEFEFMPGGKKMNGGIVPDIAISLPPAFANHPSIETDTQLAKALEVLGQTFEPADFNKPEAQN